jgi:dihydropteroate synthase
MRNIELVGILNVTPDSFSDGGLFIDPQKAIARTKELFDEGASYVDVGAESTRPDAIPLTHEQEMKRLYTVLSSIVPGYPGHISLDTYHPETVRHVAAEIGSFIINDVTGFNNPDMVQAAADLQLPVIVSHLPKTFGQDIQAAHKSKGLIDSVDQVVHQQMTTRGKLISAGIHRDLIKLDPGIGFSKTAQTKLGACVLLPSTFPTSL